MRGKLLLMMSLMEGEPVPFITQRMEFVFPAPDVQLYICDRYEQYSRGWFLRVTRRFLDEQLNLRY